MKSIIFTSALIFLSFFNLQAQDFQGMAIYESKTSTADFKSRMAGNKDISPDMQKMIEERAKQMFEKTFTLNFDKSSSIYKEEEKLDTPGQGQGGGGMRMMAAFLGGGPVYKNVKTKSYAIANEFMGKEFLVKDSLPKINWKMEGESRMIGGYNCFKATAVMPVSQADFRNMRPKKEEAKKDEAKAPDADKKTNFMDDVEMPKEMTVTAWYAPEIPVNQGPEKYWGLPGLILEVNDGKTIVLCSKIVLNPKDKVVIKEPTTGEVVSQKKYDEIVIKKTAEMREQFQNRGRNGGNGMRIGG